VGGNQRSSHTAESTVLLRSLVDGAIGGNDGLLETTFGGGTGRGWPRSGRGVAEALEERIGGHLAGDFAGGRPTHAVADDEDAELWGGGADVLVIVADAARMGAHGGAKGEHLRRGGDAVEWLG